MKSLFEMFVVFMLDNPLGQSCIQTKFLIQLSPAKQIITNIANTYLLVNLVDNDYPRGNCLYEVIEDLLSRRKLNEKLSLNTTLSEWIVQHENHKHFKQ
jgi:hypothetical protein